MIFAPNMSFLIKFIKLTMNTTEKIIISVFLMTGCYLIIYNLYLNVSNFS